MLRFPSKCDEPKVIGILVVYPAALISIAAFSGVFSAVPMDEGLLSEIFSKVAPIAGLAMIGVMPLVTVAIQIAEVWPDIRTSRTHR